MAKRKVNKSNLVREFLQTNPLAKANDVVSALKEQGHKITANLVYFLKGKSSAKKARKKRVAKAAMATTKEHTIGNPRADAITMIREVRALAEKAGGYEKLKELVDALAE